MEFYLWPLKPPKIISCVTNDLNYDRRMQRICSSLQKAGFEVLLVGRKNGNSGKLHPQSFRQFRFNCFFSNGKLFYLEYNIRLFIFLLFNRFDIVNAIDLDTILPSLFAAKIKRKKVTYDAHEYFSEVPELVGRPKTKKIWEYIAKFSIPQIDSCYTVGECLAEVFSIRYSKSFSVIRNVPKLMPLAPQNNFDSRTIIYQGALNKGRGLEEMINAMQHLENFTFLIIGEGDLSIVLRNRVKKLNLESKVIFKGFIKPDELQDYTKNAFIGYNLLANEGLSYYYSLSNKFFDYMHAGIPSLNNDWPEYKKILSKHEVGASISLQEGDIIAFIENISQNKEFYSKLAVNSLAARQIYCWENEEPLLIAIYKNLTVNALV